MMTYTEGFKSSMIRKMACPNGISASALAKEVGVPQQSLSRWLRNANVVDEPGNSSKPNEPGRTMSPKRPQDKSAEEKLKIVMEAETVADDQLGAFLRRNGIHEARILLKAPLGHTFFGCMLGFARTNTPKGADMRFYTKTHKHYCGIDLHAKKMYLCILDASGNVLLHRNIASAPESFLKAVAPFRDDLVVGVECMFAWYWLSDLCRKEGIEFILGHALFMKAVHGGKTKNDKIDSHKIAVLLRGGLFPVAYVYPPEMRATRDLLRRRCHLVRKKAELLAHIQNTSTVQSAGDRRESFLGK